jgi:hypothetical protein
VTAVALTPLSLDVLDAELDTIHWLTEDVFVLRESSTMEPLASPVSQDVVIATILEYQAALDANQVTP